MLPFLEHAEYARPETYQANRYNCDNCQQDMCHGKA